LAGSFFTAPGAGLNTVTMQPPVAANRMPISLAT